MNQGQRRHGGGGSTLLYYMGLEGKEGGRRRDRTAQAARCTGQWKGDGRTEGQGQGGKRNGRQKDRRTEKKEDGRTKEQEKRAGNLQLPSLFDATNFVTVLYGDFCLLY